MFFFTLQRLSVKNIWSKKRCATFLLPLNLKLFEATSECLYNSLAKSTYICSSHRTCNQNVFQLRSTMSLAEVKESSLSRSYFQEMMSDRKKQSQRSVLLQLSRPDDVPFALASCTKFGKVQNAYSVPADSSNCFLLVEFSGINEAQNLLLNCECKNIGDAFPVYSRIIQYEKMQTVNHPKSDINLIEDSVPVSSLKKGSSVSEVMQDLYATEGISELNTRIRYFFCTLIRDSISGLFPYCDVLPFGSSVNGIGRHGCDLDVMIRLYPEQITSNGEFFFLSKTCIGDVRALQQKTIFCLGDYFKTFFPGVSSVQKILHARMPILKLKHKILIMDCDVSINNMSAVLMSEIVHFCGEIDHRVRPLLYAVKKWAKAADITYNTPGTYITNFGLTILVIFFLQNRPVPILPPFNEALVIAGEDATPEFRIQYLKSLSELQTGATLNEESTAQLMKEFLLFLGNYSFTDCTISLMSGKTVARNKGGPIHVQYPFEEDLNITKNISEFEYRTMVEKAQISAKHLESQLNKTFTSFKDFSTILGIPNLKKRDTNWKNTANFDDLVKHSKNKAHLRKR